MTRAEQAEEVSIRVEGPYSARTTDAPTETISGEDLDWVARAEAGSLSLPGSRLRGPAIEIRPERGGALRIGDRAYRGGAIVRLHPREGLRVVNRVPLEEYLLGVVGSEIGASSPQAALEAQAIASRTYALRSGYGGLLPDGTSGQVYGGVAAESPRAHRAVVATRGRVLTWKGDLLPAYFHSTCGGSTLDASRIFDIPAVAPLSGVACGSCDGSRFFAWTASLPRSILASLSEELGAGKRFVSLEILETHSDGRPRRLRWTGVEKAVDVAPGRVRALANARLRRQSVRSDWIVSIEPAGDGIVLRGKGFGHGAGLCQVGAIRRARAGDGAEAILRHYYPGAEIRSLPPEP